MTTFEVVSAILGLLIIVGVTAIAIRLLRQPTYRYHGDRTPQGRRLFRWFDFGGPRN
jgi:hypothetical protein